jgi:hypothetical protein
MRSWCFWLGALVACEGTPAEERSATDPHTLDDRGWIALLADDPQIFATLTASGARDGWIAFHKNDYASAAQLFQDLPIPRARAYLELAIYQADLSRLSREATLRTFDLWEAKSGIPEGSALPVVAALAAAESGDDARRVAWLKKAKPQDPSVQALAARLETRLSDWSAPQVAEGPLVACVWAHLQARKSGEDLLLGEACPTGPLVTEQATGHLRRFYNPMIHGTEAAVALRAAGVAFRAAGQTEGPATPGPTAVPATIDVEALVRSAGDDDAHALETLLFSPWWTRADVIHDVEDDPSLRTAGADGPTLTELGVHGPVPKEESIEWARGRVRTLAAQLERWKQTDLPKGEGVALLDELDLVRQYQGKVLLAWARTALDQGRPHEALTFAQMALDAERSREITPVNGPGLYAVLAEADLRTGRTRESLDALEVLTTRFPEVEGLDETVGDLAILQGLDRQGDSKEN